MLLGCCLDAAASAWNTHDTGRAKLPYDWPFAVAPKAHLWLKGYHLTQILVPALKHQRVSSQQFEFLAMEQNTSTMSQKQQTHLHQNCKQMLTDKQKQTLNSEDFSLELINVINWKQALKMEGVRQPWAGLLAVTGISPAFNIIQVPLQRVWQWAWHEVAKRHTGQFDLRTQCADYTHKNWSRGASYKQRKII